MKTIAISFVLILKLSNCDIIIDSENEQNPENNRLQIEPISVKLLGLPKLPNPILQLPKKETPLEKQKKRCDLCRETIRCKTLNKCEHCTKICKDFETITTESPILGRSLSEEAPGNPPLFLENSDRYYTVGTFGPGPKQNLLSRLLNIASQDKLEKLIVLAKAKGKTQEDSDKTLIIDTANVFNNKGNQPQIFKIDSNLPRSSDMALTSKIDKELDMAIERKQKLLGQSQLTEQEMDKIIEHALTLFDHSNPANKINLQSRFADELSSSSKTLPRTVSAAKAPEVMEQKDGCVGEDCQSNLQKLDSPKSAQQDQTIVNIPLETRVKPESASQLLDKNQLRLAPENNPFFQSRINDPNVGMARSQNTDDSILARAANKNILPSEDKSAEIVGAINPLLENSQNLPQSEITNADNTGKELKTINTSHFSSMLRNLERKVEDIADLVKKTCGKNDEVKGTENKPSALDKILKSPLEILKAPQNLLPSNTAQMEPKTVDPSRQPEIVQPPNVNRAIGQIEKGTEYLINKAVDIANTLQQELSRPSAQMKQAPVLAKSPENPETSKGGSAEQVACSKEDSGEFVAVTPAGNLRQQIEPQVEQRSNFEQAATTPLANEEIKSKNRLSEEKLKTEENLGPSVSRVEVPTTNLEQLNEQQKINSPEIVKVKQASMETPENVGTEQNEGEGDDNVGCKKDDEEEDLTPMFVVPNMYRKSETQPKASDVPSKHQFPLHLPAIKPLSNLLPPLLKDTPPQEMIPKTLEPQAPLLRLPAAEENAPSAAHHEVKTQEYNTASLPDGNEQLASARQLNYGPPHSVFPFYENARQKPAQNPAQKPVQKPAQKPAQRPAQKPAQKPVQSPALNPEQDPPLLPIPEIDQRFGHGQTTPFDLEAVAAADEFHLHRPKDLPDWPQLPVKDAVVGSEMKAQPIEENSGVTTNPLNIFGRVVPQLNDSEMPFPHIPSNKVYFIGSGMQLPLNMQRHEDGSLQLSVDVDKLCSNCNSKTCNKDGKATQGKEIEDTEKESESIKENQNQMDNSNEPKKQKIGELDGRRLGPSKPLRKIRKSITEETHRSSQNLNQSEQENPDENFDFDEKDGNGRISELSKRSPTMQYPIWQDGVLPEQLVSNFPTNSVNNLDESANRINKNMREYFLKRRRLEDEYQRRNQHYLANPIEQQNPAQRRLALINNVLNWMKDVSIPEMRT